MNIWRVVATPKLDANIFKLYIAHF